MVVVLGLAMLLLPFHTLIEVATPEGPFRALAVMAGVPVAALAVMVAVALVSGRRPRAARPLIPGAAVALLLAAAAVAQPSALGAFLILHYAGAMVVAAAFAMIPRDRLIVPVAMLVVSACAQTVIGLAQIVAGSPLHLYVLGELQDPLADIGGSLAPRGTMAHAYALAGLALIAAAAALTFAIGRPERLRWLVASALSMIPVGLTYSRTALVAVGLGCAALAPMALRGSRAHRQAIAVLLLATAIPGALANEGWLDRAKSSVTRVPNRGELIGQALALIAERPLLGVGPGRYLVALEDRERRMPGSVRSPQVPHSVPVLIAADAGLAAGAAVTAMLAWLGVRALRGGGMASAAYLLFLPFVLNDHFAYTTAQGAALFGAWLGIVAVLADRST